MMSGFHQVVIWIDKECRALPITVFLLLVLGHYISRGSPVNRNPLVWNGRNGIEAPIRNKSQPTTLMGKACPSVLSVTRNQYPYVHTTFGVDLPLQDVLKMLINEEVRNTRNTENPSRGVYNADQRGREAFSPG